jgi:hypothetical protein
MAATVVSIPLLPNYIPLGTSTGIVLVGSAVLACWKDALNSRREGFEARKTWTRRVDVMAGCRDAK